MSPRLPSFIVMAYKLMPSPQRVLPARQPAACANDMRAAAVARMAGLVQQMVLCVCLPMVVVVVAPVHPPSVKQGRSR